MSGKDKRAQFFNAVRISTVEGVVCAVTSNSGEAMEKKLRLSFVWKKIIIIVQTSRYLQPDVKKIGFEV